MPQEQTWNERDLISNAGDGIVSISSKTFESIAGDYRITVSAQTKISTPTIKRKGIIGWIAYQIYQLKKVFLFRILVHNHFLYRRYIMGLPCVMTKKTDGHETWNVRDLAKEAGFDSSLFANNYTKPIAGTYMITIYPKTQVRDVRMTMARMG